MRRVFGGLLLCVLFSCQSNSITMSSTEELVGDVSPQQLLASQPSFMLEYQAYQPQASEVAAIKRITGKTITVLFGTWCHDSEREVPRLLKLFDAAQLNYDNIQLIAVNRNKQEPSGRYHKLKLRYTPTIILYDGEKELGRVIEKPIKTLGEDLSILLAQ